MATAKRIEATQPLVASILDRLLDEDELGAGDPERQRSHYVADLRLGLRRDVEALLNTHQCWLNLPGELTELRTSLLDYGMPHFVGLAVVADAAKEQFRTEVETLLRRFEPRFKRVVVTMVANADSQERTLRFRIDALVEADPAPEAMSFDTMLEPVHRSFAVTAADRD
ncbi:MAG TPA: type VI secretion system baseplate subunit TssE [Stellaceae bacterium]|jgi:type VI secretion system protein ImpF|nr:type VI secretion system baseplate subunit TssE [Stellaceae bacterium]